MNEVVNVLRLLRFVSCLLLLPLTVTSAAFAVERDRPWTPQEAHAFVHQVIEHWLDKEDEQAKELIETVLASKRSRELDPETRAALQNLSARLLWLDARSAFGRDKIEILARAEFRAVQALRDVPMSLLYWRDYTRLAVEGRGREHVWKTMTGPWVYRGHVPRTYTFETEEQRVMGRASLYLNQQHDAAAVKELRGFLENHGDACSARAYLAQLLHDFGQTDAARDAIALASPACRQIAFVARFESALADAVTRQADPAFEVVSTTGFSERITVRGERPEAHRADLENVLLQDPERLDRWYALWRMLHERPDAAGAREYEKVVALARRIQPSFQVDLADVHGQVGRGEFQRAFAASRKLLGDAEHRGDPYLHTLSLLCGAALGRDSSLQRDDLEVVRENASIASCLRHEQVEYCMNSDSRCVRGAMVRRHSQQFPAAAFERGWPLYAPADVLAYSDWRVDAEAAERLDGMHRLREEMFELNRDQDAQLAALYSRLDMVVIPKLEELSAQLRRGEIRQAELEAEMKRERARTTRELKRLGRDIENAVTVMYRDSVLTREQLRALSMRIAVNSKAIAAIDLDRFAILFKQYVDSRPREATIIHVNIMDQVRAAQGSDNDMARMVPIFLDECLRAQAPSVPCLRSLVQMVKKHLSFQIPLVPTILSLDILGVGDTVLELWDMLSKRYLSAPPPETTG